MFPLSMKIDKNVHALNLVTTSESPVVGKEIKSLTIELGYNFLCAYHGASYTESFSIFVDKY